MKRICAMLLVLAIALPCALALAETAEETILQRDSTGDAVVKLQSRLIDLGFLSGKADGIYGEKTEKAVRAFQTYLADLGHEVAIDGVAGAKTQKMLYDDAYAQRRYTLQSGDNNPLVSKLQKRLVELGYLFRYSDGRFDERTEAALKAFQEMLVASGVEGAEVSGIADAVTRKYLNSDLAGFHIVTPVYFDDENPLALEDRYLYSEACILIDADNGKMLYGKNESQKMYPASTTKIMTLLLALSRGKLDEEITIPESAAEVPQDSSKVPVQVGKKMSYRDLLYGLMIRSGNDAANAVATLTSGSVEKFVNAMNLKAGELGLKDTHFANPHGYHDENHYTTAADLAKLTRTALQNQEFKKIVSTREYTMAATAQRKELKLANSYSLLNSDSRYYYEYAFGVKTGYTSAAGQCYVGAAQKDGKTLIAVVLNAGGNKYDKWVDARRLFAYGFALNEAS